MSINIKRKVNILTHLSIHKFIYYNFFSRKIKRNVKGCILPYRRAVLDIAKGAKIILHDGHFFINYHKPKGSKAEAYVKLLKNANLEILGNTFLNYKSTIEVHQNARVEIGSAYINSGAVILAAEKIELGKDELISRDVYIFDSDHHAILNQDGEKINPAKPVKIEDHVWIGLKSTILRGSEIGEGAVIAANSVVGGKIKPGTMASGNPARSYSEIKWKE